MSMRSRSRLVVERSAEGGRVVGERAHECGDGGERDDERAAEATRVGADGAGRALAGVDALDAEGERAERDVVAFERRAFGRHGARAAVLERDDCGARRGRELAREQVVDLRALAVADVVGPRWREVRHVEHARAPEHRHLDGFERRVLALARVDGTGALEEHVAGSARIFRSGRCQGRRCPRVFRETARF